MDFICSEVRAEYERWMREFPDDPYSAGNTVGIYDVLRAHFLIADYFFDAGAGIGGIGPRDSSLLHSAVYRQFVSFGGMEKWRNEYERCATLLYGLVKDHPFHDANKRTALLVTLYFLQKNNRVPTTSQRELEDFVVEVAEDSLAKYRRFADMEKSDVPDAEIRFIADFFKRNTRQVDRRSYTITFQDLNRILNTKFSAGLENPSGNYIDVVKYETRRPVLGLFGKPERRASRVANIGFPGWKKQVSAGAIKTVRTELGLLPIRGVDSQAFFGSADPLNSLIEEYSGPLSRLADR